MDVEIEKRGPFSVIGLEKSGSVEDAQEWVPELWKEFFIRYDEIEEFVEKDRSSEAWGLMSGADDYLDPWEDEGRYLAGFEVDGDIDAPEGWTVWEMPEQTYAVIGCKMETYIDSYNYVVREYLPEHGYELSGAVHEFYPEEFEDIEEDTLYLYIAVENRKD